MRLLFTAFWFGLTATGAAIEPTKPGWFVSNGFHSSLAFRVRDLSFAREISGDQHAQCLLIGWGASDYYRGRVNLWTLVKALFGLGPSLLHVVPVDGPVRNRFSHNDIIRINLPAPRFAALIIRIDRAFTRSPGGLRISGGRGYYRDSRFYLGCERFYFPYMCNTWVALKLRRSGLPIFVPTAIVTGNLIHHSAAFGFVQRHRITPVDGF